MSVPESSVEKDAHLRLVPSAVTRPGSDKAPRSAERGVRGCGEGRGQR